MWRLMVLEIVRKVLPFLWLRLRMAMRTKTAKAGCVVVGGALSAYGLDKADGAEAIAGIIIGFGMIGFKSIPFDKLMKYVPINKLIGLVFRSKLKK